MPGRSVRVPDAHRTKFNGLYIDGFNGLDIARDFKAVVRRPGSERDRSHRAVYH